MSSIKILIVDDHEIIHKGLEGILKSDKFHVVGHAYNGEEAIQKVKSLKPDIVFMDISMPKMNGLDATRILSIDYPKSKIITLTQHNGNEYVLQSLKAGAMGYIMKNSGKDEFIDAIERVMEGKTHLSDEITKSMIQNITDKNETENTSEAIRLTRREKEIIQKISEDKMNQEIAEELNISLRTVETHRRNLMQKLKVNTVVGLLTYAAKNNLISFD